MELYEADESLTRCLPLKYFGSQCTHHKGLNMLLKFIAIFLLHSNLARFLYVVSKGLNVALIGPKPCTLDDIGRLSFAPITWALSRCSDCLLFRTCVLLQSNLLRFLNVNSLVLD